MSPSLAAGDVVWVDLSARQLPSPGDVVVVRDPSNADRVLVKRVRSRGQVSFSVGSDNPIEGRDSRHFGSLSVDAMIGQALYSWSPEGGFRACS